MISQASGEEKYLYQLRLGQFYYYQLGDLERAYQALDAILAEAPHHREATEQRAQGAGGRSQTRRWPGSQIRRLEQYLLHGHPAQLP